MLTVVFGFVVLCLCLFHWQHRRCESSEQGDASTPLAPNVSAARKCCSSVCQTDTFITVGTRRVRCEEVLFQPKTHELPNGEVIAAGAKRVRYGGSVVPVKLSACKIHVTSFQSNRECDVYIRNYLHVNVVLSNGNVPRDR